MVIDKQLTFLIILTSLLVIVSCKDQYSELKKLRTDLLTSYDPHSRPVKSPSSVVNVTFQLMLFQIVDLNIETQTFHADGYLLLTWTDEFLEWDPSSYAGIKRVNFDTSEIWTPDIVPYNMAPGMSTIGKNRHTMVFAHSTGQITYVAASNIAVGCYIDLSDYPFDSQSCVMDFGSWVYNMKEINLVRRLPSKRLTFGPYYPNPEWSVLNITENIYSESTDFGDISVVRIVMKLSRRVDIHQYYILLPYLTASLLGIVVFFLPIGSYLRLVFGGLSLFILINLLLFLAINLGFHSLGVPYAIRCVSINILLISVSLIVTNLTYQLIMSLMMTCPPLPSLLANQLANPLVGKVFCLFGEVDLTDQDEESSVDLSGQQQSSPSTGQPFSSTSRAVVREWVRLIRLIDRILLIIYIIALIFYHS